jgi:hypothetical protein
VKRFLNVLPVEHWKLEAEDLVSIARRTIVRWKLDAGEPINAAELALLSRKARQTINNKLARPQEIIGSQPHIKAKDALDWLACQPDFYLSIWQEQDDSDTFSDPEREMDDIAFVPVAKDGTFFHPGLRRDGVYLVDTEGAEQKIKDFDAALEILQKMYFPEWRRPAEGGRWTRVRGLSWQRMQRVDLEAIGKEFERRNKNGTTSESDGKA